MYSIPLSTAAVAAYGRDLVLLHSKIGASDGFGNFHITNTK